MDIYAFGTQRKSASWVVTEVLKRTMRMIIAIHRLDYNFLLRQCHRFALQNNNSNMNSKITQQTYCVTNSAEQELLQYDEQAINGPGSFLIRQNTGIHGWINSTNNSQNITESANVSKNVSQPDFKPEISMSFINKNQQLTNTRANTIKYKRQKKESQNIFETLTKSSKFHTIDVKTVNVIGETYEAKDKKSYSHKKVYHNFRILSHKNTISPMKQQKDIRKYSQSFDKSVYFRLKKHQNLKNLSVINYPLTTIFPTEKQEELLKTKVSFYLQKRSSYE